MRRATVVERIRRHLTHNAIAYLALFFALSGSAYAAVKVGSGQVADNSLRSVDIRDHSIKGVDVARGTLRAENFRTGVLPKGAGAGTAGGAGTQGPPGPRGPSFGDGRQLNNVATIACNTPVVVGTQNLTVAQPSRIWVHGQGTLNDNGSLGNEFGLFLRLRDAGDTATVATTTSLVDREDVGDAHYPLSPGGILLTGSSTELNAPAFVAPPGAYILQLVAQVGGPGCGAGPFPSFGFNSGSSMGYLLVGNG
jgi:hypothetical protein